MIEDIINKYYKDKKSLKPRLDDLASINGSDKLNLTTLNIGLGDAVILTALTKDQSKNLNIYSENKHWQSLCKFNTSLNKNIDFGQYIRTELLEFFDIGNGHLAQRLQRAIGLNIESKPTPYINVHSQVNKKKIGLHFSTGISAFDLLNKGFQNPRQLLDESKTIIESFINESEYEFYEFGQKSIFRNEKVTSLSSLSIEESIIKLAECEYFIGLNSGFMNIAAGLNIKSIIVVNAPHAKDLYLPVLVDCSKEDMNWLYPQNVHLFQNDENKLVPRLSIDSIKKAINGEVYPYWETKYLNLIYDKNFSR
jgi:hypothetical protein